MRTGPRDDPDTTRAAADRPLAATRPGARVRLGEVLLRSGCITREQLAHALTQQQTRHLPLGQLLIKLGYVTDDTMREALARQLNVSFIDLDRMTIDKSLARIINHQYARRQVLVPVALLAQTLTVCMDDPTNLAVREELARTTGLLITVVTASREAITRASARLYDERASSGAGGIDTILVTDGEKETSKSKYVVEYRQSKKTEVVLRRLLGIAVTHRASDVHLETLSTGMLVRFRIDGVLERLDLGDLQALCDESAREIVSRLKVLAKLDIAEKRRPQDGGFRVRVQRNDEQISVDLRMSVVPSYHGESVVLRLLDRKNSPNSIAQLNFPPAIADKWQQLLQRPGGMLLATGPTGSGKTTTLYASLMTIYRPQIRVVTAEDPIEYVYEQFSQSEVNDKIGNTFASYLRAFLRHDPEIIMVGEIRDEETAEMAFRAVQTGHLLLSTLHTETAVGTVTRLRDLKVDANTLASGLAGVISQRLVRRVCAACAVEYEPPQELLRAFFARRPSGLSFHKGSGCKECNYSGYRGRMTLVELWAPDDQDILLIAQNAPFDEVRASARRTTFSMADSMMAALNGSETTLEELVRVMPYSSIAELRQRQSQKPRAVPTDQITAAAG